MAVMARAEAKEELHRVAALYRRGLNGHGSRDSGTAAAAAAVRAEALAAARSLVLAQPRYARAWHLLACVLDAPCGDGGGGDGAAAREEALAAIQRAIELRPSAAKFHATHGAILAHAADGGGGNDEAGALSHFRRALSLEKAPVYAVHVADCCRRLKRHEEAADAYKTALSLVESADHEFDTLHYRFGRSLRALRRTSEAEEQFRLALARKPEDEAARYWLATCAGGDDGKGVTTCPADYVRKLYDGYARNFEKHLVGKLGYRTPHLLKRAVLDEAEAAGRKQQKSGSDGNSSTPPPQWQRVLDLGCGTGLAGVEFRAHVAGHLEGVDLSPAMVKEADKHTYGDARKVYDCLRVDDLTSALAAQAPASLDLVLAVDVFVYVGDLSEVFSACALAMAPGGVFAFSVEAAPELSTKRTVTSGREEEHKGATADGGDIVSGSYVLTRTGRFAHRRLGVLRLAERCGFSASLVRASEIRRQAGEAVVGTLFVLRRF